MARDIISTGIVDIIMVTDFPVAPTKPITQIDARNATSIGKNTPLRLLKQKYRTSKMTSADIKLNLMVSVELSAISADIRGIPKYTTFTASPFRGSTISLNAFLSFVPSIPSFVSTIMRPTFPSGEINFPFIMLSARSDFLSSFASSSVLGNTSTVSFTSMPSSVETIFGIFKKELRETTNGASSNLSTMVLNLFR